MSEPILILDKLSRQERLLLFHLLQALHQRPTLDLDSQSLSALSPLGVDALVRFLEKARGFSLLLEEGANQQHYPLFSTLHLNRDRLSLRLALNPACVAILESLPYTLSDLQELQALSRQYSKTLYRLLQHSKHMHMVRFEWEDFKKRMGIPPSCKSNYAYNQILRPVLLECKRYTISLCQLSMSRSIKNKCLHFVDFKFNTRSPVLHRQSKLNSLAKQLSAQLECDQSLSFEIMNSKPRSVKEKHHLINLHDHGCSLLATFYNQNAHQEWGMHFENLESLLGYMRSSQDHLWVPG